MYFERKNIITSDVNCQTFEILTMPNKDMKSNDPSKTKNSTRNNKGHSWHVCFVGFIVEAVQSEAHAEAHKPVVGKTQQHKVHTYYKLMLAKGIKYLI